MIRAARGRQRGLSLLEFTLFTIIMAVLIAFALDRIAALRLHMERAAVEHNVARMREALALQFAELVVTNRLQEAPDYGGSNPWMQEVLAGGYEGERKLPAPGERKPGKWYFDTAIGNVVYVPRYPEALEWSEGEPRLLRWRVRPDWVDRDDDGEFDRGTERVVGLELVRLDAARWR